MIPLQVQVPVLVTTILLSVLFVVETEGPLVLVVRGELDTSLYSRGIVRLCRGDWSRGP